MKPAGIIFFLVGWACAPAHAAEPMPHESTRPHRTAAPTDTLIFSGQLDDLSPGSGGGGGALDWVRSAANDTKLTAGAASYSIADSRWWFGRAGGAFRLHDRVTVHGQASLGRGHRTGSNFAYRLFNPALAYQVSSSLYLKFENQYVDIDTTRGHLPKAGVLASLSPALTADLGYAHSLGGNLNTDILSIRLDWAAQPARLLGGLAVGRSTPDLVNVDVGGGTPEQRLRQRFAGAAVPVGRLEAVASIDWLDLGSVRRRTLTLGLKVPLEGS